MDEAGGVPREWVAQLSRARDGLTVADEVGLALRAHRRQLCMSQRAYALARGLSRAMLARLEAGAGRMSLDTIVDALDGTGFALHVTGVDDPGPVPDGGRCAVGLPVGGDEDAPRSQRRVSQDVWEPTDLVARVRGGSRRFPAHRRVLPVTNPPLWWWMHEFFKGPSEEPKWYAPVCHLDRITPSNADEDGAATGAA